MSAPDTQIAQFIANAIQRRLDLDQNQCFVAAAPDYDPAWKGDFVVEVCPADMQPYGGGEGAQDGGVWLLREQRFVLWCFYRTKLDPYSRSTMLLIEQGKGILEKFETIRQLFAQAMFPTVVSPQSSSDFALIEPIAWSGESPTQWEDPELRIVRRSMTLTCCYGVQLGSAPSLALTDYQ